MPSWLILLLVLLPVDKSDDDFTEDFVTSIKSLMVDPLNVAGDLTLSSSNTDSNKKFLRAGALLRHG